MIYVGVAAFAHGGRWIIDSHLPSPPELELPSQTGEEEEEEERAAGNR